MPPLIVWALGAVGATVIARWLIREAHRVNAELDAKRAASVSEAGQERPTLKADPETGIYRPS
jgi:hypothetical protein